MCVCLTEDHDAATHAPLAQELEQRLEVANFEVRSTRTATEDRDVLTERFNIITIILMVMAFLMATVGRHGADGHDEHQRTGAHAGDWRDARHRRIYALDPAHLRGQRASRSA